MTTTTDLPASAPERLERLEGLEGLERLDRAGLRCLFTVLGVDGDDDLAQRLRAAGLWIDATVEVVGSALFGDPMLIELHGFRLALRRSEAERVTVRMVEPRA